MLLAEEKMKRTKRKKIKLLKCDYCGQKKEDVYERPDSYANDVNNEPDARHVACDQCDQDRRDDI